MIESFGATDLGRARQLNEDSLLVDDEFGLYIVADGMGGHNAGEIASQLAVETVFNFVQRSRGDEDITWPYGVDPKLSINSNRLRTAIMLANRRVWREADNRREYTGMGTTIVSALLTGDTVSFAWAGDSRAYRIRSGELEQITTDDSWVQAAIREGVLRPEEANTHPMRNIITKAVGAREEIDVRSREERLEDGDLYLLCTDGLHGMVEDPSILQIAKQSAGDLERSVRDLIGAANKNGGKDNITAIVFRYRR